MMLLKISSDKFLKNKLIAIIGISFSNILAAVKAQLIDIKPRANLMDDDFSFE